MSKDQKLYKTEADHMVETTIGFIPDSEGILKSFVDRYSAMLIHDSILMEEHPSPHDHHGDVLHPHGETSHFYKFGSFDDTHHELPSLEDLLR